MTIPEFSRVVGVNTLPRGGRTIAIEADEAERAALARRFDLLALDEFRARFTLTPGRGDTVVVAGALAAAVVQRCVVTLDPVPAAVEDEIEAVFADAAGRDEAEVEVDPLTAEVEPLVDGRIDLGELAAQHLSLTLDPYPRSPDAPEPAAEPPEGEPETRRPFAVLKGGGDDKAED
ncbi:YceD family protein [Inquilinus sp. NPDC058860]|uniref:YceD family protein n=1 Tax=Inquilinus sp. NPDC058860 TaxID=3346652 RepID=UPI00368679D7